MKKTNPALWKCRAMQNEENQTTVSLVLHSPWKSLPRFPHFHNTDECGFLLKPKQKGAQPYPPSPRPLRLILR